MHDVFSKQANVAGDAGTATAALCLPQPMTENHFRSKYFTKNKTPQAYLWGFVGKQPSTKVEGFATIAETTSHQACLRPAPESPAGNPDPADFDLH